ncbi:MAG TPA: aminoacyl-tRNA hydrolase [candidate division Zixibacteria bacterium]
MATEFSQCCVVCLGNPGSRYEATRHNLGWWVGDCLALQMRMGFRPGRGNFTVALGHMRGNSVCLVKPMTYMNASGEVWPDLVRGYGAVPEKTLVVCDDIDLPLGRIRVRDTGSSGGHNGLSSIIECIGTEQIARVRCGVGPVPAGIDPAAFVLDPFAPAELPLARQMAERAAAAVEMAVTSGMTASANEYNRRAPAPEDSVEPPAGADRPGENT